MPKLLRLTLGHAEELPSPLAIRLQLPGSSRPRQVALRKAFEVPAEAPVQLKFYNSGELIGLAFLTFGRDVDNETKWVPVGLCEVESKWENLPGSCSSGPRLKVTLETVKPLSPIEEASEGLEAVLSPSDFQREKQQLESRLKAEIHQLAAALEKTKAALRQESVSSESLAEALAQSEDRSTSLAAKLEALQSTCKVQEETLRRKTTENAELTRRVSAVENSNSALETRVKATESRLAEATNQLSRLKSEHQESTSRAQSLAGELAAAKSALKQPTDTGKPAMLSAVEAENAVLTLEVGELQKVIARLKTDLESSHSEAERRDKELQSVTAFLEVCRAKNQSLEATVKVLRTTKPLLVPDDSLQDYECRRKSKPQFDRLSDGKYQYGDKEVGVPVVRTESKKMPLETFVRKVEDKSFECTHSARKPSLGKLEIRAKSVDLERSQLLYRSAASFMELVAKPTDSDISPTQRVRTEHSVDYGTSGKKMVQLLKRCSETACKDYLRGTISSTNKVIEKSRTPRGEKPKSRVMKM